MQPLSRGRAAEDDRLSKAEAMEESAGCCTEYLTLRCARERERISRTPSENLPKIFSKNFRKNLEVTKKRLTFANAFPLKRELEKRLFFERL